MKIASGRTFTLPTSSTTCDASRCGRRSSSADRMRGTGTATITNVGALRQIAQRGRAELAGDLGVLVVGPVRHPGLGEELPERPSEAPVAEQGHGFTRSCAAIYSAPARVRTPFGSGILGGVRFGRSSWCAAASSPLRSACAPAPVVVTPAAAPPSRLSHRRLRRPRGRARERERPSTSACAAAGDAPCAGASAGECTARALSAWSEATDDRDVACVARMLADACSLAGRARLRVRRTAVARRSRHSPRRAARARHAAARAATAAWRWPAASAARWLGEGSHADRRAGRAGAAGPARGASARA